MVSLRCLACAAAVASSFEYDERSAVLDTWVNQALDCDFSQRADLSRWDCGLACDGAPLANVTVLRNATLHTFGIAALQGDDCLLAFRGTKDWRNVVTDANSFWTAPWAEECPGCQVHKSWYNAYTSLAAQARAALSGLGCAGRRTRVTGHSLGAAMASVAAFELAGEYPLRAVYTYGQPRTGNAAWVAAAKARLQGAPFFRVVDFQDPAAHLNKGEHQSPEVYYTATRLGAYRVCEETEQANCSAQWKPNPIQAAFHACQHCAYLGMSPCDCGHAEPRCSAGESLLV